MFDEILLLCLVLSGSLTLTGCVRRYAIKHHLLDWPNQRSSHLIPTPRGGGLGIVVPFLIALVYFYVVGSIEYRTLMAFFVGGALVAGIGYRDDHKSLSARTRLLGHFAAAIWATAWIGGIPRLHLGFLTWEWGWIGNIVSVVSIVWLLNLYNFMDGIDGIAGSEGVFIAGAGGLFLFVLGAEGLAWLAWTLAIACVGFLFWNWPPAKIFMGDVGSGFLGYTLGVLVVSSAKETDTAPWIWLVLLGVFITDTTVTLIRRLYRGEKWSEAHHSHAYQHATNLLGNHLRVTLGVIGINLLVLLPLSAIICQWPNVALPVTLIAAVPLLAIVWYFKAGIEASAKSANNE